MSRRKKRRNRNKKIGLIIAGLTIPKQISSEDREYRLSRRDTARVAHMGNVMDNQTDAIYKALYPAPGTHPTASSHNQLVADESYKHLEMSRRHALRNADDPERLAKAIRDYGNDQPPRRIGE